MQECELRPFRAADIRFQNHALDGVSRTFALTIPQLPQGLREVVGNAYLLCRIADTIEDEPALSLKQKRHFSEQFINVVAGLEDPDQFATSLVTQLTRSTTADERNLIRNSARVIRITHACTDFQRHELTRCIRIMSRGMAEFQMNASVHGLTDMSALDRYCYCVAGVVGEMLTELFCNYCPETAQQYDKLIKLAVSFGQALQMTNILKDVWDDHARGVCWFPRDIFQDAGFDLSTLAQDHSTPNYIEGIHQLVQITHAHQTNALHYIQLLSPTQSGMRRHCLWALGMSILTLKNIYRNPTFSNGKEVKISRLTVKSLIAEAQTALSSNQALTELFNRLSGDFKFSESHKALVLK